MDPSSEGSSKGVDTAPPKNGPWAFLAEAKDKMIAAKAKVAQKVQQFKANQKLNLVRLQMAKENAQKVNVRKKLAQVAIVAAMQIDDTGTFMAQTNMIPKEQQTAGMGNFLPDKQVEHPTIKQTNVAAAGKPPQQGELKQVVLNGKPVAEVRNGVVSRPAPTSTAK